MRVLVTCWAWSSHYLPLVPVLWALRAAGHEVRVASQSAMAGVVTDSGASFVQAGPDVDHERLRAERMNGLRHDRVPAAPPPGVSGGEHWRPGQREKVARVFGVFAARADLMVDDTLEFARRWRPDVVLFEPTSYAGPLVAALLGIPAVRHIHGVDLTYQAHELVPEVLAPTTARLGLDACRILGDLTVDPCPPSMQIPARVERASVGYVPYNGRAVLPDWLWEPPSRPRVCLTWGATTTSLGGAATFLLPTVISALAELDVELVVAVGRRDREQLGQVPAGVRVTSGVALHQLLPTCSALVHQGGFGSTLTGVYYGVPQLVLPQLVDQIFAADRLAATGAGACLPRDQVSAATLRDRVRDLLTSCRPAAERLRAELRAQPTPNDIVPVLEGLAA